jgi:hypothetical protein
VSRRRLAKIWIGSGTSATQDARTPNRARRWLKYPGSVADECQVNYSEITACVLVKEEFCVDVTERFQKLIDQLVREHIAVFESDVSVTLKCEPGAASSTESES